MIIKASYTISEEVPVDLRNIEHEKFVGVSDFIVEQKTYFGYIFDFVSAETDQLKPVGISAEYRHVRTLNNLCRMLVHDDGVWVVRTIPEEMIEIEEKDVRDFIKQQINA